VIGDHGQMANGKGLKVSKRAEIDLPAAFPSGLAKRQMAKG